MELATTPCLSSGVEPALAVAEQGRALLDAACLDPAYREALRLALALPGNLLSVAPDTRWARIVWTCCGATGGGWERAIPAAAAVEIFMVALDLLDDLEDGEAQAICAAIGQSRVLNVSTGLLFLASRRLLDVAGGPATRLLLEHGLRACAGQHSDLAPPASHAPRLDQALAITAAKSGSLVAAICRIGALIAGADEARQDQFARFGRSLGVAAQLANDIAALDPAAGKADASLGRPTLPLAFAAMCCADGEPDDADRLPGTAQAYAWVVAEAYRRFALDLIPCLTADPAARAGLIALLHVL